MGRLIWLKEWARGTWRDPLQHFEKRMTRTCPCCGFEGYFVSAKRRKAREFRCPSCASRPRDRQIGLLLGKSNFDFDGKRILHFAPEWWIFRRFRENALYVGGDIIRRPNANAVVDITDIKFPEEHFDVLIANHVLEHVPDDRRGIRECHRVLNETGFAILSVPVDPQRETTWEPPPDMPADEVERICGWDHKRVYGRDFADRLRESGFVVEPLKYDARAKETYRLLEPEIYLAAKRPGVLERFALSL